MAAKDRRTAREIEADLRAAAARANDPLYLEAAAAIHSLASAVRAVAKGERLSKVAVVIAGCPRRNAYKREAYDAARAMGRRLDAMGVKLDVYQMALKVYEREIARLKQSQLPIAAETTPSLDALASNASNA